MTSAGARGADLHVEVLDQAIPGRDACDEIAPEPLIPALFEIVDRHALLLHPGEVPEIEDTLAVDMSQLEDVIVHDAFQMAAEDLAGIDLIEPVAITARQKSLSLAGVEQRAVGRDCHDHIVSVDFAAPDQVAAPGIAAEQQVEGIARQIRYTDDEVGIHDVVDQRNMLVADTLDVVLAVSIAKHRRAFESLGRDDFRAMP